MATAYIYTTAKRHNSTLAPTGGTSITVELKGGSDIINPVFLLATSGGLPNYSMIAFEGRYYFVTGIKNIRKDLWEIYCHVDVLATYKSNIQAMSPYVLYYTHSNSEISDHRLSIKTTQTTQRNTAAFGQFGKGSAFVLTAVGQDGVASYAMIESSLHGLIEQSFFTSLDNNLNNITPVDSSGSTGQTIADAIRWFADMLQTEIGSFTYSDNAPGNIKSCHILPIQYASIGGTVTQIYLGRMNTGKTGLLITDRIFTDSVSVAIPWQASDWRRNAPYHELFLYIPCVGLTQISPSDVIGESSITVKISMDKFSGDSVVEVKTSTKTIAYYTGNFATPYPVGASQITPAKAATAIGSAVAALAASANPAVTLGMASLGLANQIAPNVTCIGANGGGAILGIDADKVNCISIFHDTTVSPGSVSAEKGTPYNGVLSLSGVSGYVQTAGASVSGAMTDTEREEINQLMDGGFYIE